MSGSVPARSPPPVSPTSLASHDVGGPAAASTNVPPGHGIEAEGDSYAAEYIQRGEPHRTGAIHHARSKGPQDHRPQFREYDRKSGSEVTGVKAIPKKSGAGSHNWGTVMDEIDAQLEYPSTAAEWRNLGEMEPVGIVSGETVARNEPAWLATPSGGQQMEVKDPSKKAGNRWGDTSSVPRPLDPSEFPDLSKTIETRVARGELSQEELESKKAEDKVKQLNVHDQPRQVQPQLAASPGRAQ